MYHCIRKMIQMETACQPISLNIFYYFIIKVINFIINITVGLFNAKKSHLLCCQYLIIIIIYIYTILYYSYKMLIQYHYRHEHGGC